MKHDTKSMFYLCCTIRLQVFVAFHTTQVFCTIQSTALENLKLFEPKFLQTKIMSNTIMLKKKIILVRYGREHFCFNAATRRR